RVPRSDRVLYTLVISRSPVIDENQVDYEEAMPRDDALVAHPADLFPQKAQQLHLEVGARREVGMTALGGDDEMAVAVPDQERLAEPRARRDQGHVPLARGAGLERLERGPWEREHAVARRLDVVEQPDPRRGDARSER